MDGCTHGRNFERLRLCSKFSRQVVLLFCAGSRKVPSKPVTVIQSLSPLTKLKAEPRPAGQHAGRGLLFAHVFLLKYMMSFDVSMISSGLIRAGSTHERVVEVVFAS